MAQISSISIDTSSAKKSIADLEKELQETNEQLKNVDINSKAFTDLQKKAADAKGQLDQINKTTDTLSKGFQGFGENLAKVTGGISGGITAATAAMQLMGVENENVVEGIAKLQQLMAFTQGISSLKDLGEGFKGVTSALKASTTAGKLFKVVLNPAFFLAITAAVVAIKAAWAKFGDEIERHLPIIKRIKEYFQDNTEAMNKQREALEELNKKIDDYEKKIASEEISNKVSKLNDAAKKSYEELGKEIERTKYEQQKLGRQQLEDTTLTREQYNNITKEISKLEDHLVDLRKQQRDLLDDSKNYSKQVVKTIKDEINPALVAAQKNLDLLDANIYRRQKLRAGYLGSKKELQDRILRQEQLLLLYKQFYKTEEATIIKIEADLEALKKEYTDTFDIISKKYGQFDKSIGKHLAGGKGLLTGALGFSNYSDTVKPLQEYLDVLFKDSEKLLDQFKEVTTEEAAKLFTSSDFFETFFVDWYKKFEQIKKSVNQAFEAGLIDEETKNAFIANTYASYASLTKVIDYLEEWPKGAAEHYKDLQNQYIKELSGNYTAHLQFMRDYYIRLQEIEGTNYSYEIAIWQSRLDEALATKEETKNLIEDINTLGTSQFEQRRIQYEAQQKLLESSLSMQLITQEQFNESSKQLTKNFLNTNAQYYSQYMNLIGDVFGNIADMQDTTSREGFEKQKKLQSAQATINMLAGVVAATSGLFTTKTGPWDWVLAGLQTTAIITAGLANIKKINQQTYDSASSASVSANVGNTTIIPPTHYTQAVQGANIESQLKDTRVVLVESDVQAVGKRVSVQENENTY